MAMSKYLRKRRSNAEKKAILDRMEQLLRRPHMTINKAAYMLDIPPSAYHAWKRGRGYKPDGKPTAARNGHSGPYPKGKPKPEVAIVKVPEPSTLPKAAKLAATVKALALPNMSLMVENGTVLLECKEEVLMRALTLLKDGFGSYRVAR